MDGFIAGNGTGRSSGSAVAVAGGLAYGSLGTDTAGSVRIPAATCGLVGLKTTHGLIPTGGLFPLAPSLDGIGILARTAADARQLLRPLAPALSEPARPQRPRVRAWLPSDWLHPQVAKPLSALAQRLQADWPALHALLASFFDGAEAPLTRPATAP